MTGHSLGLGVLFKELGSSTLRPSEQLTSLVQYLLVVIDSKRLAIVFDGALNFLLQESF